VPLLLSALLPILVMPITATRGWPANLLLALVFNLLILQSILTLPVIAGVSYARLRQEIFRWVGMVGGLGLWVPVLMGTWPGGVFRAVEMVLLSLFFLATSMRLVRLLARVPRVNVQVMAGAAAGYLHLGLTGGVLATATQVLVPGSFSLGAAASNQLLLDRLTYFSFVTIAGVGYGDVLPANAVGERFVILLSVASTLYVALLVGLLLGRFIASEEVEMLEDDALGLDQVDGSGQP
jgi:voltage-gated potassium channel